MGNAMPLRRDMSERRTDAPATPAVESTVIELPPPVRHPMPLAERYSEEIGAFIRAAVPMLLGLLVFGMVWAWISSHTALPGPAKTWKSALDVFSDPFYRKGPNDQGIGWNILY